ncbi:hypothetical protein GCM10010182_00090 [Actinomadura cremea]|nr:hypothetical protein GCM10010182_00090 [Actinomadura cremea]
MAVRGVELDAVRRQGVANDLSSSQLWAVTDNVNQSKSDQDPAEWKPSPTSFHCVYARSWIEVKYRYGLTGMLNRC